MISSLLDPTAPRVHWPQAGTQDGREERAHLHRGAAEGQRGTPGTADGTEQGRHPVWPRRFRKHSPHVNGAEEERDVCGDQDPSCFIY